WCHGSVSRETSHSTVTGPARRPAPTTPPSRAIWGPASVDERCEGDLVRLSLGGDAEAFQALTRRYYRPVAAFLLRRLGRSDVVEALAQETFLEAYRSLRQGARPQHFSSWLFGIASNRAGKYLRRRRPLLFDPGTPPAQPAVEPELTAREEQEETQHLLKLLDVELAGLPDETRE